jgi:ubiquitin-protein ligase
MNTAARAAPSPGKGGAPDAARPLDTGAVTKRLQQELMGLMASGGDGVSAFPAGDSLFDWVGTINGADGTPYEGCTFRLSLRFTSEYPFKPPGVRFDTPCFHPNVDTHGNICLDILKEKWSAAYSVKTVLQSIQSLLADPNVDSPLNSHAAKLWGTAGEQYRELVLRAYNGPRPAAS